ncbi:replication protein A DNA-binding subunit [Thecamonas trahens ATCC 50062]|uniref:Replication protein A subunit n=1 Tax=Thecamonas trahens ATCC 50062 TaxID=461836 RepID=A0A0L0DQK0_THETB|nr:replication protein A DNA-binding subunit [Thecamonas trahens ATCC 50062]KNC54564.1 replication protein A DNA-binding subunit [Thecamonas trahens ATCC 50062]|eukprot:XP_013753579.1 replication protein A DNA-binding subunit [Thecamonas trahens ATCC 50062]
MSLTEGAIKAMYEGQDVSNPVVQIIDIKKIAAQQADNPDRYRLVISDGKHYQQAILATQLNQLVHTEMLKNNSLVRLTESLCNTVHGRRVVILIALDIVSQADARIGSPVNAEQTLTGPTDGGAPAAVAAAASASTMATSARPTMGAPAASGAPVPEAHITRIADLHPYQQRWTIKARVTNKSDIRTWKKPSSEGKLFSFEVLDAAGGEIKIAAFNDQCDKWQPVIQQGSVYYITGGSLKMADKRWSRTNSPYEMTLRAESEVILCTAPATEIKAQHYNFVKISAIAELPKDTNVDVIGVVTKIHPLGSVTSKTRGTQIPKRDIEIMDDTAHLVQVTLWGNRAEAFNYPGAPVVAFKGVRISDYNGKSLSTGASSGISVSPDIPEAAQLKGWYETAGAAAGQGVNISAGGGGSFSKVYKTFSQIDTQNLGHGEKPDWFWVRGTISYIRSDGTLYYPACPNEKPDGRTCNRKVVEIGTGRWQCESCSKEFTSINYRYVLSVSAADHTGSFWLSAFDDSAPTLLGKTAAEMAALKEADDPAYQHAFEEATFKAYNFRLRAKVETYRDEDRVRCTVMRAVPIDFVADSEALLTRIEQYAA